MKAFLRFASICLLVLAGFSCSPRISGGSAVIPEIIRTDSISRKFNLQLDFGKHHFSGMLIARRMHNNEVRLLFTTYFGLSVFDFSLLGDSLHVNSCVEPLRKEKIRKILEKDFALLFSPGKNVRVKRKEPGFEKRTVGGGVTKAVITMNNFLDGVPQRIQLKHPWIRLKIQLDKIEIL